MSLDDTRRLRALMTKQYIFTTQYTSKQRGRISSSRAARSSARGTHFYNTKQRLARSSALMTKHIQDRISSEVIGANDEINLPKLTKQRLARVGPGRAAAARSSTRGVAWGPRTRARQWWRPALGGVSAASSVWRGRRGEESAKNARKKMALVYIGHTPLLPVPSPHRE